jgi:hypothetical protein
MAELNNGEKEAARCQGADAEPPTFISSNESPRFAVTPTEEVVRRETYFVTLISSMNTMRTIQM